MSETFYLDREGQRKLVKLLREIPSLVEDLAITICRRDRIARPMPGGRTSVERVEMPLPINLDAVDAADALADTLLQWVQDVCEARQISWAGPTNALTLAKWLDRNVIALALTDGADNAPGQIGHRIKMARRTVDLPADEICAEPDTEKINLSYDMLLTARELAGIMPQLGEKPLKADTIHSWTDRSRHGDNALAHKEIPGVKGHVYRLGDVLAIRRAREAARSQRMSEVS